MKRWGKKEQTGKIHFALCPIYLKDIRFKASAKEEDTIKQAKELIWQSYLNLLFSLFIFLVKAKNAVLIYCHNRGTSY